VAWALVSMHLGQLLPSSRQSPTYAGRVLPLLQHLMPRIHILKPVYQQVHALVRLLGSLGWQPPLCMEDVYCCSRAWTWLSNPHAFLAAHRSPGQWLPTAVLPAGELELQVAPAAAGYPMLRWDGLFGQQGQNGWQFPCRLWFK
jgi:hypothetical protein